MHSNLNISKQSKAKIIQKLKILYGKSESEKIYSELEVIILKYKNKIKNKKQHRKQFSQKDVVLITYGDFIQDKRKPSLRILNEFAEKNLKEIINIIHILPFYPHSSDRGFSVIDYKKVDPRLGNWQDIKKMNKNFDPMFDFVCNHVSSKNNWFEKYALGNRNYKDFFVAFDRNNKPNKKEIARVFRPRPSSLLKKCKLSIGEKWIWRTFSSDQLDLNYSNYKVLLKMLDIFLFYAHKKAEIIRLDAIGYIWKKIGTSCFLTKESHTFVQLLRSVLDEVNPSTSIIAEINTGIFYKESMKYFGDGKNEAQMVYNFVFAPLALHTFYTQNVTKISKYINQLNKEYRGNGNAFLNLLDSHDGIAVAGIEGKNMLGEFDAKKLLEKIKLKGGRVSYRTYKEKGRVPYELNITWWSALNDKNGKESLSLKVKRYLASRAIVLSVSGVPGIYLLGLFGIENNVMGVKKTGQKRDINRRNLTEKEINNFLNVGSGKEYLVFRGLTDLIKIRINEKVFHPNAKQRVLSIDKNIFSLLRTSIDKKERVLVLINVSGKTKNLKIDSKRYKIKNGSQFIDLISKEEILVENKVIDVSLEPYQIRWIKIKH